MQVLHCSMAYYAIYKQGMNSSKWNLQIREVEITESIGRAEQRGAACLPCPADAEVASNLYKRWLNSIVDTFPC